MRFATFNIYNGRSPADQTVDPDRFATAIGELDADILALQEVDRDQPRSGGADFTALAAQAMGAVAHRFVAAIAGTPGATWMAATGDEQPGTAAYGVALLSRYPVRDWHVIRMAPIPFRFPLWLSHARKWIVVKEEPRTAVIARVETPDGTVTVANTHLSFVPHWNRRQLARLTADLAAYPDPLLLLGDLNLEPPAVVAVTGYRSLGVGTTFPVAAPTQQLDHVLLRAAKGTPNPVCRSETRVLPVSDHRALVVDVDGSLEPSRSSAVPPPPS